MPIDVLVMIFAYLDPKDMLSLSRSTKDFRAFLLDSSTAPVWKAARRNAPYLPAKPEDMSEPMFAHLFFDKFCHHCLKPGVGEMYWVLAGRFCVSCLQDATVNPTNCDYQRKRSLMVTDSGTKVPVPTFRFAYQRRDRVYGERASVSEWAMTLRRWEKVKGNKQLEKVFVEREYTRCAERDAIAKEWAEWERRRDAEHSRQLKDHRYDRLRGVIKNLRELGWGCEVDSMGELTDDHELFNLPLVRLSRPWGPQSWAKVKADAIRVVQDIREKRILAERKVSFNTRHKYLQRFIDRLSKRFDIVFPHEREFFEFPEIKALVDAPTSQIVAQADFDALEGVTTNHVASWREDIKQRIMEKFCKEADFDIPDYATAEKLAIFNAATCSVSYCDVHLLPARMFTHNCFHRSECRSYQETAEKTEYAKWVDSMLGPVLWVPTMSFNTQCVKMLLELCGKDPLATTAEEMDKCDIRFRCNRCPRRYRGLLTGSQQIFTWRSLIFDHSRETRQSHIQEFAVVHPQDAEQVAPLEAAIRAKSLADKQKRVRMIWYCSLCPKDNNWRSTHDEVVKHIQTSHEVAEPSEEHMMVDSSAYSKHRSVFLIQKGAPVATVDEDARDGLLDDTAVIGDIHAPLVP
ncbi:hypothetical protein K474DRAFT_1670181 [Panus rudis PR-1116 ss-1]|nr:hypothetical protein K474DRAFT_1670181 [Panus rudis PR-1116 ss-1]